MFTFKINDMTCGHCVGSITAAVRSIDPAATVQVDLGRREAAVDTRATRAAVEAAIREAGYTPQSVGQTAAKAPVAASGCCCGSAARRAG
ncbi:MAG: hypothetical protein RJA99_4617 [Pseudomonadota bacterium]|jgi:copper chaperone